MTFCIFPTTYICRGTQNPNIVICCADESKFVRVSFQLQKTCNFGEQFLIVGGDPVLGSWDPLEALPMTWSEGHVWAVELVSKICSEFENIVGSKSFINVVYASFV